MLFDSWQFSYQLVKKFFDRLRSFRLAFVKKWKIKRNIIIIFCFFIFEKCIASSQKVICCLWRRSLKRTAVSKLVWQISFCDFSLKDEKRSGHLVEVDDDLIKAIIDSDRHSTTREIAEKLHVSHTCIENHLKQLGCSKTRYMDSSRIKRKAFNATH